MDVTLPPQTPMKPLIEWPTTGLHPPPAEPIGEKVQRERAERAEAQAGELLAENRRLWRAVADLQDAAGTALGGLRLCRGEANQSDRALSIESLNDVIRDVTVSFDQASALLDCMVALAPAKNP